MTEKNTLSILENIKKKMQKFDQEAKKIETISDIDDEFEYIVSSKNMPAEKISDRAEKFLIEKELMSEDRKSSDIQMTDEESEQPQVISYVEDDINLDDLGLDDEDRLQSKAPEDPNTPAVQTKVPVQENLEEEIELDHEEEDLMENEEEIKKTTEEKIEVENEEDDLDFDLDFDEEEQEENAQKIEPQTLKKLPDTEEDLEASEEIKAEAPKNNSSLDDIDLDKLLEEEEGNSKQEELLKKDATETDATETDATETDAAGTDDIDDEEFFKDEVSEVSPGQNNSPNLSNEINDDIDLDDIDLDEDSFEETAVLEDSKNDPTVFAPQDANISKPQILRQKTVREASQSIKKLIDTNLIINDVKRLSQNTPIFTEIAMQILEPKLETWLNDHLPSLVEKIVQDEIRKIIPRGQ